MSSPRRKRSISARAAELCEHSDSNRCSCRCGGKYHGATRVDDVRALDIHDPHYPGRQMTLHDWLLEEREWRTDA